MKISTITCHDVYNLGASLQAYALAEYLKSLGHQVEIIDYKPDYLSRHYALWEVFNPRFDRPVLRELYLMAKLPERLKGRLGRRKREFDSFTHAMLPLTAKTYHSCGELRQEPPDSAVFFAGSDQIWNALFPNGKDPAFYLDFVPQGRVKASYAASFATDAVPEAYREQIAGWLKGLNCISVRERSAVKLVEELGISGAVPVLDPVFLLTADQWKQIEKKIVDGEEYLLVYDFDGNDAVREYARRLAASRGWKIYSVFANDYCDRCFSEEGPLGFLNLVRNARFVVSNSFHATAFSLIFQKQFVVFNRAEKINTRMRDLTEAAGIQGAVIQAGQAFCEPAAIDYEKAGAQLEKAILRSKEYIEMAIGSAHND